ncbi:MAG: FkbM family methyltransferase [Myxococcota bacterium]
MGRSRVVLNGMDHRTHLAAQPNAFVSLCDVLGREAPLVIVDGGAHVGRVTYQLLQIFPNATVHAFEPVSETYRQLHQHFASEPRARCWNVALGRSASTVEMRVNGCTGTSSAFDSESRLLRYHGDKAVTVRTETANVVSLDQWAADNGVPGTDLLKLDLQGFELEALRGATELLASSVRAIYSEAQLTPLYRGAALFSDIDIFLRAQGFELFRIQELFFNGGELRSTCCDAIWLRADVMAAYIERTAHRAA